ncbi:transcription/translation regulatory transformer protein RfaH [Psychromonas sp. MME2]|uniref:transcription/translation regulatory transformer protein RfaH n=1 Tax=Psychromonas sp. MME2 TaxID=3231033 RepID=UPI00339CD3AC
MMAKKWFVIYCKSREEQRAVENLQQQGIDSFFPKISKEKILRGKKSIIQEALFPSYLFVFIDPKDAAFSSIQSTRGVLDFIRFGAKIAQVNIDLIEKLKNICASNNALQSLPEQFLSYGDSVEILHGPFQGLSAIFSQTDGLERSVLLLNVLNQENKISFRNSDINKLEH